MQVIKRNGDMVDFSEDKIFDAINKAANETDLGIDYELARDIASSIEEELEDNDFSPSVEYIQDMVEDALMCSNRRDIAKQYILYREERNQLRNQGWEMTDLQRDIYEKKYRFENESFDEFLDRVSGGNNKIKKLIRDKKVLPAGRILAGRGLNEKGHKVCYSNCFVITPPEDNLESIFDTAKNMARTYSFGGGAGTSLGKLRPNNAKVNNSARQTTGSVSFADLYSMTTGLIGQKNRRGALMLSMPITHPDVIEFINLKTDLERVTKANTSLMITDDFMQSVKEDKDWEMRFEVEDTDEVITRTARARDILHLLAKNNHAVAEPGMLYWDRVESWHLNSENSDFKYASTNPCGEKPLVSGGSCLLMSINLSEYVKNPFTKNASFDIENFSQDVKEIVVYMDDVLNEGIQYLPLEEQRESAEKYRQLGIGTMGMADMFIKMGIRYGKEDSLELIRKVFSIMANAAIQQSALLSKEYGTYPAYDKCAVLSSPYLNFVATPETYSMVEQYGLRHSELLSIAPTGSVSTMLGVSGGCEPIFQHSYTRKSESLGEDGEDVYYKVYTPIVREYMYKNNITNEEDLPDFFVTAMDLDYKERVNVQAELQKYIDSAISSTVNLPEDTTVEEIMNLYIHAWEKGLKGITVYRENCLRGGILTTNKVKDKDKLNEISKLTSATLVEDQDKCPMCGGKMMHSGGCNECQDCGYSPCSI